MFLLVLLNPVVLQNLFTVVSKANTREGWYISSLALENASFKWFLPVQACFPQIHQEQPEMTATSRCKNLFIQNSDKYVLLHTTQKCFACYIKRCVENSKSKN